MIVETVESMAPRVPDCNAELTQPDERASIGDEDAGASSLFFFIWRSDIDRADTASPNHASRPYQPIARPVRRGSAAP
jgi:hypothetical protein